jgi:hypothetical protein
MTRFYSLHSCVLAVHAWPELTAAIQARLEFFAVDAQPAHDIEFLFEASNGEPAEPIVGRCVYEFADGEVLYDDLSDRLSIVVGDRVRATCNPASGRARIVVDAPQPSDLYVLSHPIVSLLLMESLKRRSLYPLHAATVALDGHGVLLAGTSGAGKSTLSVALARRGFSFLGDDTVFLQQNASGWCARAFPDQVDLCPDAADVLARAWDSHDTAMPGWHKRQVRADRVSSNPIPWSVSPRTLIFPRVSGRPTSTLRPLSREEALFELAPNVLLTNAAASQEHLNALAAVIEQCDCYRLDTGRDLDDAVDVIRTAIGAGMLA